MFTGIVEGIGVVRAVERRGLTARYEFESHFDMHGTNTGDSVSVNGCCLTLTSRLGNRFWADISDETLRITTLGNLGIGSEVNLERAMQVGSRLGGHIVQGHIDGVGKILSFQEVEGGRELEIQIPERLGRYMVEKGSVAVDGVSLTINHVKGERIFIRLIPHTVQTTVFKNRIAGDHLNLEVDILGKYVEKLRGFEGDDAEKESVITEDFLKKHGF